jgi:hypothetical protein
MHSASIRRWFSAIRRHVDGAGARAGANATLALWESITSPSAKT